MIDVLCPPALLYVVFYVTHNNIYIKKKLNKNAFLKFRVIFLFTLLLNLLCKQGLGIISWFIVFIPFIMMTIITSILLFIFKLSPSAGDMDYTVISPDQVDVESCTKPPGPGT